MCAGVSLKVEQSSFKHKSAHSSDLIRGLYNASEAQDPPNHLNAENTLPSSVFLPHAILCGWAFSTLPFQQPPQASLVEEMSEQAKVPLGATKSLVQQIPASPSGSLCFK